MYTDTHIHTCSLSQTRTHTFFSLSHSLLIHITLYILSHFTSERPQSVRYVVTCCKSKKNNWKKTFFVKITISRLCTQNFSFDISHICDTYTFLKFLSGDIQLWICRLFLRWRWGIFCQFYQNFTSSFFTNFLSLKKYKHKQ